MTLKTWDSYNLDSDKYISQYESLDTEKAIPNITEIVSELSGKALDIGAGTGRDARWLASQGFYVTAIEPSKELRNFGEKQSKNIDIQWIDSCLPKLEALNDFDKFDFILLNASWQHVLPVDREFAIDRLYNLLNQSGKILITLRSKPSDDGRLMYLVSHEEIEKLFDKYQNITISGNELKRTSLLYSDVEFQTVIITKG